TALKEMRALVYALRPKSLERDGLEAALRDHVDALQRVHGAAIEVRARGGEPRLAPSVELALLRIAQEALHNALRHAPGARLQVESVPGAGTTVTATIPRRATSRAS